MEIHKKTLLFSSPNGLFIEVLTPLGVKPFHYSDIPGAKKVNIPELGHYYFSDSPTLIKPIEYNKKDIQLPKKERNDTTPFDFDLIIKREDIGKSPARIFRQYGIIETGDNFENMNVQERMFILLHEIGHFYYQTESKCDTFAAKYYLLLGYNPSQAVNCLIKTFTKNGAITTEQEQRINNLIELMR